MTAIVKQEVCGVTSARNPAVVSDNLLTGLALLYTLPSYAHVDVVCYTFHTRMLLPSIHIRKVVACKILGKIPHSFVSFRLLAHLHTKMFLCYSNNKKIADVFIGSWNFSPPSYVELCYRLPKKEHKNCKDYFNQLWAQ